MVETTTLSPGFPDDEYCEEDGDDKLSQEQEPASPHRVLVSQDFFHTGERLSTSPDGGDSEVKISESGNSYSRPPDFWNSSVKTNLRDS